MTKTQLDSFQQNAVLRIGNSKSSNLWTLKWFMEKNNEIPQMHLEEFKNLLREHGFIIFEGFGSWGGGNTYVRLSAALKRQYHK